MKEIIIYSEPEGAEKALLESQKHDTWLSLNALKAHMDPKKPKAVFDTELSDAAEASRRRLMLTTTTQSFDVPGSAVITDANGDLVRFESLGDGEAHMQSVTVDGTTTHLKTISRRQHDIDVG